MKIKLFHIFILEDSFIEIQQITQKVKVILACFFVFLFFL